MKRFIDELLLVWADEDCDREKFCPSMFQIMLELTAARWSLARVDAEDPVYSKLTIELAELYRFQLNPTGDTAHIIEFITAKLKSLEPHLSHSEEEFDAMRLEMEEFSNPSHPMYLTNVMSVYEAAIEVTEPLSTELWAFSNFEYAKLLLFMAQVGLPVSQAAIERLKITAIALRQLKQYELAANLEQEAKKLDIPIVPAGILNQKLYIQTRSLLLTAEAELIELNDQQRIQLIVGYLLSAEATTTFTLGQKLSRHRDIDSFMLGVMLKGIKEHEWPEASEQAMDRARREYEKLLSLDAIDIEVRGFAIREQLQSLLLTVGDLNSAQMFCIVLLQVGTSVPEYEAAHSDRIAHLLLSLWTDIHRRAPDEMEERMPLAKDFVIPFLTRHFERRYTGREMMVRWLLLIELVLTNTQTPDYNYDDTSFYYCGRAFMLLANNDPAEDQAFLNDFGELFEGESTDIAVLLAAVLERQPDLLQTFCGGREDLLDRSIIRFREAVAYHRKTGNVAQEVNSSVSLVAALYVRQDKRSSTMIECNTIVRHIWKIASPEMLDDTIKSIYFTVTGEAPPQPTGTNALPDEGTRGEIEPDNSNPSVTNRPEIKGDGHGGNLVKAEPVFILERFKSRFIQARALLLMEANEEIQFDALTFAQLMVVYTEAMESTTALTSGAKLERHSEVPELVELMLREFSGQGWPSPTELAEDRARREFEKLLSTDAVVIEGYVLDLRESAQAELLEVGTHHIALLCCNLLLDYSFKYPDYEDTHWEQIALLVMSLWDGLNHDDSLIKEALKQGRFLELFVVPFLTRCVERRYPDLEIAVRVAIWTELIIKSEAGSSDLDVKDPSLQTGMRHFSGKAFALLASAHNKNRPRNIDEFEPFLQVQNGEVFTVKLLLMRGLEQMLLAVKIIFDSVESRQDWSVKRLRESVSGNRELGNVNNEISAAYSLASILYEREREFDSSVLESQNLMRRVAEIAEHGTMDEDFRQLFFAITGEEPPAGLCKPGRSGIVSGHDTNSDDLDSRQASLRMGWNIFKFEVETFFHKVSRHNGELNGEFILIMAEGPAYQKQFEQLGERTDLPADIRQEVLSIHRQLLASLARVVDLMEKKYSEREQSEQTAKQETGLDAAYFTELAWGFRKRALALAREEGAPNYEIIALLSQLAESLILRNERPSHLEVGLEWLEEALELIDQSYPAIAVLNVRYFRGLANLFSARWMERQKSQASRFRRLIEEAQPNNNSSSTSAQKTADVESREKSYWGRLSQARKDMEFVVSGAAHLSEHEFSARAGQTLGEIYGTLGLYARQAQAYQSALIGYEQMRLLELDIIDRMDETRWIFELSSRIVDLAFKVCDARLAVRGLEANRGRSLGEAAILSGPPIEGLTAEQGAEFRDLFASALDHMQQLAIIARLYHTQEQRKAGGKEMEAALADDAVAGNHFHEVKRATQRIAQLVRIVQTADPSYRFGLVAAPVTQLAAATQRLDATLIWMRLSDENIVLATLDGSNSAQARQLPWIEGAKDASPLANLALLGSDSRLSHLTSLLYRLGESVGQALMELVGPTSTEVVPRFIVVPDAYSGCLALGALPIEVDGTQLLDVAELMVFPSATLLDSSSKRPPFQDAEKNLKKSGTIFLRGHDSNLGLLELDQHYQARRGSYILDGNASAEEIWRHIGNSEVVAIGGHALFDSLAPLQSRIVLPKGRSLTALQILQRSELSGTRLVFLGGCETTSTNDGDPIGEMFGLHTALLAAGVGCVVGATRPVLDTVAFFFGGRFFELMDEGATVAEAARHASLWLRDANRDEKRRRARVWLGITPRSKKSKDDPFWAAWEELSSYTLDFKANDEWASFLVVGDGTLRLKAPAGVK